VDVYRTPEERFEGLPGYGFQPHYVDQDGLRLHYLDEGSGDPVLLLHGEPTWSYLYRKMIPGLAPAARCIAPDYFGFGRSDKPVDREWYTYGRHCETVAQLLEQLDLTGVTVVVQDWGGPIGLRVAVENQDRVARLVVLNTGIYSGRPPNEAWFRFRDFVRRVGTDLRPGQLINVTAGGTLPPEIVAAYDAPWPAPESKAGVLMFPELVATGDDHPSAEPMRRVRDELRRWEKPALVLFSDSDPIFSTKTAERMSELIPGAGPAETVAGAGHFLQEEKGEEIAERISRFLRET
jgi:haloalkane dehalogenase